MENKRLDFLEHVKLLKKIQHPTSGFYAIADFILENKENYTLWNKKLTIFQLALLTHTSSSSITRFAQKLGLTGFKELIATLRSKDALLQLDKISDNNFLFRSKVAINEVYQNIKIIKKINEDLRIKKRIFFFGVKENILLVKILIPLLEESGIKIYFNDDLAEQETYLAKLSKRDLVVLVSLDFNSEIFSEIFKIAQKLNLVTIIITKNWQSQLLNEFKQKYVLKLRSLNDGFFQNQVNEVSMLFYFKIIFTALLDLKIVE